MKAEANSHRESERGLAAGVGTERTLRIVALPTGSGGMLGGKLGDTGRGGMLGGKLCVTGSGGMLGGKLCVTGSGGMLGGKPSLGGGSELAADTVCPTLIRMPE